jgi:hypothetical protein
MPTRRSGCCAPRPPARPGAPVSPPASLKDSDELIGTRPEAGEAPALARLHQLNREMMATVRRVCRNVKRWRNADGVR